MKMLKILMLTIIVVTVQQASAQKCYVPKKMTEDQVSVVKGVWKGSYQYEGKEVPVTFNLYASGNACTMDAAPIKGKETGEQIRFCDGGEFHFKKYVGEYSYEFQGTPKEGKMSGILTVRKNDEKIGSNGKFSVQQL